MSLPAAASTSTAARRSGHGALEGASLTGGGGGGAAVAAVAEAAAEVAAVVGAAGVVAAEVVAVVAAEVAAAEAAVAEEVRRRRIIGRAKRHELADSAARSPSSRPSRHVTGAPAADWTRNTSSLSRAHSRLCHRTSKSSLIAPRRFDRLARRYAEECDREVASRARRDGRRGERRVPRRERPAVRIHWHGHIDSFDIDDRPSRGRRRGKCPGVAGGLAGPGDLVIEPLRQRQVLRRVAVAPIKSQPLGGIIEAVLESARRRRRQARLPQPH